MSWADAVRGRPVAGGSDVRGVSLVVDGADRVRVTGDGRVALLKGGGGCLLQEKLVVQHSRLGDGGAFWAIVDESKFAEGPLLSCGFPVPIEVTKESVYLLHHLLAESGRTTSIVTRSGSGKCGPLVPDIGMYFVEVVFRAESARSGAVVGGGGFAAADAWIRSLVPGVAATGIFHDASAPTDVFWVDAARDPQRRCFGSITKRKRTA
jgi:ribose 5-phosphate isomerase